MITNTITKIVRLKRSAKIYLAKPYGEHKVLTCSRKSLNSLKLSVGDEIILP